jgi:general secretion pathway protein E
MDALARPQGVVLAAGPPGSGRTTTIYAAVEHVRHCREIMPTPEQFAGELFVPEIRDTGTAELAMRGALAGCLVVSTMHAHDGARAIRRLISLGVPPGFLAAKVQAIVAQRLVRTVCASCREETAVRNALLDSSLPLSEWRGTGGDCERCGGSGYRGWTGIFELVVMDDSLRRELAHYAVGITRQLSLSLTRASLYQDGLRLVRAGVTTVDEVLRVTALDRRDVTN